jgi:hypothetical protein
VTSDVVLVCQRCRSNGGLRKVSAVVAEGSVGNSKTNLASKLDMPGLQSFSGHDGYDYAWGCIGSGLLWILLTYLIGAALSLSGNGATVLFFVGVALSMVVISIVFVSKDAGARKGAEARRLTWMKMKHIWDDLYFCSRDDIVFSAKNPASYIVSNQMLEWLLSEADRI